MNQKKSTKSFYKGLNFFLIFSNYNLTGLIFNLEMFILFNKPIKIRICFEIEIYFCLLLKKFLNFDPLETMFGKLRIYMLFYYLV